MATRTLGSLLVRMLYDTKSFEKSARKMETAMKRSGRKYQRWGQSFSRQITLPFIAASTAGAKFFLETEKGFAKVENLVGVTGKELQFFKSELAGLSVPLGAFQSDLANTLFTATSGGARGRVALEAVTQATKAMAFGMGQADQSARAATAAVNAYGPEVLSASRAMDIFTATVRAGNLQAEDLAPNFSKLLGLAPKLKISMAQLAAGVATYTRIGASAEDATTGFASIMTIILNPTKKTRKALEALGLTAQDLRDMVGEKGLAQTLAFLIDKTKGNDDALGSLIPNVRALRAAMGTAGVQGETYLEVLKEIENSTGLVDKAFANVSKTAGFQFKAALVKLRNAGELLGQKVIPVAIKAIGILSDMFDKFAALSPKVQENIFKWTLLAAAIGPVLSLFGSLKLLGAGLIGTVIRPLAAGLINLTKAFLGIGAIANPISLIVGVIAGGAILIVKNWGAVRGAIVKVNNALIRLYNDSVIFQGLYDGLSFVIEGVVASIQNMFQSLMFYLGGISAAASKLFSRDFKGAGEAIKAAHQLVKDLIQESDKDLSTAWGEIFTHTKLEPIDETDVDNAVAPMVSAFEKLQEKFKNIFSGSSQGVGGGVPQVAGPSQTQGEPFPTPQTMNPLEGMASPEQVRGVKLVLKAFKMLSQTGTVVKQTFGEVGDVMSTAMNVTQNAIEETALAIEQRMFSLKESFEAIKEGMKQSFSVGFAEVLGNIFSSTGEKVSELNAQLREQQQIMNDKSNNKEQREAAEARIKSIEAEIAAEKQKGNVFLQTASLILDTARQEIQAQFAVAMASMLAGSAKFGPVGFLAAALGGIAVLTAMFKKHVPKLAEGHVATQPLFAMFGEYGGAGRGNAEIVTPENKMRDVFSRELKKAVGALSAMVPKISLPKLDNSLDLSVPGLEYISKMFPSFGEISFDQSLLVPALSDPISQKYNNETLSALSGQASQQIEITGEFLLHNRDLRASLEEAIINYKSTSGY